MAKVGTQCSLCPDLVASRQRICWGECYTTELAYADNPQVLCLAESPGHEEDRTGRPLIGVSGQEARHHLTINGIARYGIWLDNVIKCHPVGDRNPTASELANCSEAWLITQILEQQPRWIITMGAYSTRHVLGDVSLEMVHGIPHPVSILGHECIVIPTYHPAAGLHSPETMILFHADMAAAGAIVRGEVKSHPVRDEWEGRETYTLVGEDLSGLALDLTGAHEIAIDTESDGPKAWCLSLSVAPGRSWVVMADNEHALAVVRRSVRSPDTTTIIHNAAYDLPVLASMGVRPAKFADTMVMAYLLQSEPQGLKPLAFRHCGMVMSAYEEMVAGATRERAVAYLHRVMEREWPDPAPVLEWKKGEPYVRQPVNILRKVKRVLDEVNSGGDVDPYSRWTKMDGTDEVTAAFGPLREATLADIPVEDAVRYSARDADATIRVYPVLWERIRGLGLDDTFWRDMRAMPMVVDMMGNGMPVDVRAFEQLSQYFEERKDAIQSTIQGMVGRYLAGKAANPGSAVQMAEVIYDHLRLQDRGGKYKSKKGAKTRSTADDILKRYIGLHPVVQEIIDWREYQSLKTKFADAVPKLVSPDGRVRSTIRMTRTTTGRLSSSSPNLMAQPVRSDEGRKVRDCYVAGDEWEFLSGDYSQVEMRVAANGSKDERMMSIFWSREDIHSQTASWMFGVPLEQLDEMKHRYPAKRVGFGILNLITAQGLHRELQVGGARGISESDCEEMIKSWFNIYSGVAAYMKANGEQAKRNGYVRDMWGRIRYIPGIRSVNRWARLEAERQAGNAPIQMGAQGIIKEAMGRLVPWYRTGEIKGSVKTLIQIHDDLVWEVREGMVPVVAPQIGRIMTTVSPPDFIIPLEVDFKHGKRWGSMEKLKPIG